VPHLTDHDLRQMDDAWQQRLSESAARAVLGRVLDDLKEARDRLNQNADNSSRPPGSLPPWEQRGADAEDQEDDEAEIPGPRGAAEAREEAADASPAEAPPVSARAPSDRKPGKQRGAKGYGRTQKLVVHEVVCRHPETCAACGEVLTAQAVGQAYTGWDTIELLPLPDGEAGLKLGVTRHLLHELDCGCGHRTRARHEHAPPDTLWGEVELGEWRLLGSRLASLLVLLTLRYRLSRVKVKELLAELFGLDVSTGLIDQTIREAGRAVAPLEDPLVAEIEQAALAHVDETSWPEAGQPLWLWVFVTAQTVLYLIGYRTKEMVANVLSEQFPGHLMTDGYGVYRSYPNRLRCWAHLKRKLVGLAESTDRRVAAVGARLHDAFEALQQAMYAARESGPPPGVLASGNAALIDTLRQECERHRDDPHGALRQVVREFLLDWEVILRPLSEPWLPLTNNEAERALRHYVIARRISHGTRSDIGSRAFALLASVIETCRRRGAAALDFLGSVIAAARKGLALPALPEIQLVAP
jgi:transposase